MTPTDVDEISWYHTLELPGGRRTKGWVDCNPVLDQVLIPARLDGMRALDVGTWDGFWAFELERRGADVVTIDIDDPELWDWPPLMRTQAHEAERRAVVEGTDLGDGFRLARSLLGSNVSQQAINVYDLSQEAVGAFDIVVVGSILLHLRDPVAALNAIRGVARGPVVLNEAIELIPTLLSPRTPRARLEGDVAVRWWQPNLAAVRAFAGSAGLEVQDATRPFFIPLGEAHPRPSIRQQLKAPLKAAGREHLIAWRRGIPHTSVLCEALH
jgi:tRNA (mo5U34)-methyltransferase